jgi:hypothetical protein
MDEFVRYHINGDGECNTVVLVEWANRHSLDLQERFELAYFFSITYAVESAIILFENREKVLGNINAWVHENKRKIVFQSDRKYMRMKDSFEKCLEWFKGHRNVDDFLNRVQSGEVIDLEIAINFIEGWTMFGRFSAFLFLEMFVNLIGAKIENTTIDWKHGNTATSGLLNLFGYDKAAATFDKTGQLAVPVEKMDEYLKKLIRMIEKAGGSANVTEIETSLCAYRKFYKGSRYNGYYLDRMLEEVNAMKNDYPSIIKEVLDIRRKKFDAKYLGEIGGWCSIRPSMKKVYRETGLIT